MPYSYPFTHNLRNESIFKENLRRISGEILNRESYNNFLSDRTKTERNVATELISYMHLKKPDYTPTNIAKEILLGNEKTVLANIIKKFQYPNLCATKGYQAIENGIKLAPMKTILKLLFLKHIDNPFIEAKLTLNEVSTFIFSNPTVFRAGANVDYIRLWNEILEYRKTNTYPSEIVSDISIELRDLRDMFKLMSYSGLVNYENEDGTEYVALPITIDQDNKQLIEEICNYSGFLEIEDNSPASKVNYYNYMDIQSQIDNHEPNTHLFHILSWFKNNPSEIYSEDLIANFHINLNCLVDKHFVILSGTSGTGKTNLVKQYANAVYNLQPDENNPYFQLISVRADWEDEKPLLGYYNALQDKYETPKFLEVLLLAEFNPEKNFYICLDEMNLAHVEYYFSDFLSAVEANEPISLNGHALKELHIPNNFFIIGTINEDETTERISDKVLDRAFKMELSEVDIDNFVKNYCEEFSRDERIISDLVILGELNSILKDYQMQFGYRIVKEAIEKMHYNYQELDSYFSSEFILDSIIVEKITTKIKVEYLDLEGAEALINITDVDKFPNSKQKFLSFKEMIESSDIWGS
ncbi:hypothetical protein M3152_12940 [Sporosarcina luteola]|uniref:McrB family protein n=1 Tax=Sporosarcina luteola TaxID=582850 RepID=UPI002040519C|nr:hypothetical protein [Sporosarcina luteola]MCM3638604.1 hypothetical protein [Sporosarcina luteola]